LITGPLKVRLRLLKVRLRLLKVRLRLLKVRLRLLKVRLRVLKVRLRVLEVWLRLLKVWLRVLKVRLRVGRWRVRSPLIIRCGAIWLPVVDRVRMASWTLVVVGRRAGPMAAAFRAIALSSNRVGHRRSER
jgi:hypothetical protein